MVCHPHTGSESPRHVPTVHAKPARAMYDPNVSTLPHTIQRGTQLEVRKGWVVAESEREKVEQGIGADRTMRAYFNPTPTPQITHHNKASHPYLSRVSLDVTGR